MITQQNRHWWVFVGAGIMIMLANLDTTIVNLALPTIGRQFGAKLSQLQWIANSYVLAGATFFVIGGRLADLFGRTLIFLIGIVFFVISSIVIALSPNLLMIILFRFTQGIGFAFTLGLALLMMTKAFPIGQRGTVIGTALIISGASQSLGPTIGGILINYLSWHWIFWLNLPWGCLSFWIIWRTRQAETLTHTNESFDFIGCGLLIAGLLLGMYAITQAYWLLLILSAACIVFFYKRETKIDHPLIHCELLNNKAYLSACMLRFCVMYIFASVAFLMPIYLQNIQAYNPLKTGFIMLSLTILFGALSPFMGRWQDRVGVKQPLLTSILIAACGFILLAISCYYGYLPTLIIALAGLGYSLSISIGGTANAAMQAASEKHSGIGIGAFFTISFIGSALSIAIAGAQIRWITRYLMDLRVQQFGLELSDAQLAFLPHLADGAHPLSELTKEFGYKTLAILTHIVTLGYQQALASVMLVNLLVLGAAWYFWRRL